MTPRSGQVWRHRLTRERAHIIGVSIDSIFVVFDSGDTDLYPPADFSKLFDYVWSTK